MYYKYVKGIPRYYNFGWCPNCGEFYISKEEEYPPVYRELDEICRFCEEGVENPEVEMEKELGYGDQPTKEPEEEKIS